MAKRVLILIFLLLALYVWNAFANPFPSRSSIEGFKPSYGFSWSFERARWFGLDGRDSYTDLLDSISVDWVRLPFFWNTMAKKDGGTWVFTSEFDDLKYAIGEAEKRNVKVIIALGAKTPYFPEYHLPSDLALKVGFGESISHTSPVASDLLKVDEMVVRELSSYGNIIYWQVENEPFLANVNNWEITKELLQTEITKVRLADGYGRPVIVNHVGPSVFDRQWKDLIPLMQEGDVFGANAYFKTEGTYLFSFKLVGNEVNVPWIRGFSWPVQSWLFLSPNFYEIRKVLQARGYDLWIMEMQAEPYIRTLEDAGGKHAFSAGDVAKANKFLLNSRVKSIGLWGGEFWMYAKSRGDESWIKAVQGVVR